MSDRRCEFESWPQHSAGRVCQPRLGRGVHIAVGCRVPDAGQGNGGGGRARLIQRDRFQLPRGVITIIAADRTLQGLAFMGVAAGLIGGAIAESRRQEYYDNYYYGGGPRYYGPGPGYGYYGGPRYYNPY